MLKSYYTMTLLFANCTLGFLILNDKTCIEPVNLIFKKKLDNVALNTFQIIYLHYSCVISILSPYHIYHTNLVSYFHAQLPLTGRLYIYKFLILPCGLYGFVLNYQYITLILILYCIENISLHRKYIFAA